MNHEYFQVKFIFRNTQWAAGQNIESAMHIQPLPPTSATAKWTEDSIETSF